MNKVRSNPQPGAPNVAVLSHCQDGAFEAPGCSGGPTLSDDDDEGDDAGDEGSLLSDCLPSVCRSESPAGQNNGNSVYMCCFLFESE